MGALESLCGVLSIDVLPVSMLITIDWLTDVHTWINTLTFHFLPLVQLLLDGDWAYEHLLSGQDFSGTGQCNFARIKCDDADCSGLVEIASVKASPTFL